MDKMKLFVIDKGDNLKCGGCNWQVQNFYGLGTTKRNAKDAFEKSEGYGRGLCASCFCDMLVEEGYKIEK